MRVLNFAATPDALISQGSSPVSRDFNVILDTWHDCVIGKRVKLRGIGIERELLGLDPEIYRASVVV